MEITAQVLYACQDYNSYSDHIYCIVLQGLKKCYAKLPMVLEQMIACEWDLVETFSRRECAFFYTLDHEIDNN